MARYTFYKHENEIICVSHYAGKPVRAVAKCAPQDEFDEETGKSIAKLRVDVKVAEKRFKRLAAERKHLGDMIDDLYEKYYKIDDQFCEAYDVCNRLKGALASLMENPS